MPKFSKILIVKTSAIGDVLQTFPVLDSLKAHCPDAQIDWLVERPSASLLEAHPHLNHVHVIDTKKWRRAPFRHFHDIRACLQKLRQTQYDLLFDLQGNAKSGFFTLFSKAHCKVGYSWRCLPEKINYLTTHKHLFVPKELDVRSRLLYIIETLFGKTPQKIETTSSKRPNFPPTLMVCFGSNWKNKQLSDEQLQTLLEKIVDYSHPHLLFIYGNDKEEKKARQLEAQFPNSRAIGGLSLLEWQTLMTEVDLILTMDSAALHLAATTTTPTFSLFGPSSMHAYKPPGNQHCSIQGSCPYGVQFDMRCPRLRTCQTGACLTALDVEEIFLSLKKMLDRFLSLQEDLHIALKGSDLI